MSNNPKIHVVIPVFNRVDHTVSCLKDFSKQDYENYEVIIVDDGSSDGTSETVRKKFPNVVLLQGDGHLFWTGGTNVGVEHVLKKAPDSDYVLTINNDVRIKNDYLSYTMRAALLNKNSIIGSLCVFMDNNEMIETSGFIMNWKTGHANPLERCGTMRKGHNKGLKPITHTCGKGVLIPVKVFRDIGLYDGNNFPHYHADSALTLKAHISGYKVFTNYDSVVQSDTTSTGLAGMNTPPSLKDFVRSFSSIRSANYWPARQNFARVFFGKRAWLYLLNTYGRTLLGFAWRYGRYILSTAKRRCLRTMCK